MAREIRQAVAGLEGTMLAGLAVLATASGYWTYMGVRGLLDGDGLLAVGGALVYSVAVSVGIYVFWAYLLKIMPLVRGGRARAGLVAAMVLGCGAIVAMSSWLNAAALAGAGAVEQHMAFSVEDYQKRLELAHENALAAQSLLPNLALAAGRFEALADQEREGALTGTSGRGTVVQLLAQTARDLRGLAAQIEGARPRVETLFQQGSQRLSAMRTLVSGAGQVAFRTVQFAEEAVALTAVIVDLEQTSVAPAVKRAAEDLAFSFVAPAPSGGSSALGLAQAAVIREVEEAIASTSRQLVLAAEEILQRPDAEPLRFIPLSAAEAVIRYAGDFVPSWAGAIAIDLLPAVLVLILMVAYSVMRDGEGEIERDPVWRMTAGEMNAALSAFRRLQEAERAVAEPPPTPAREPPAAEPPAEIRSVLARRGGTDG